MMNLTIAKANKYNLMMNLEDATSVEDENLVYAAADYIQSVDQETVVKAFECINKMSDQLRNDIFEDLGFECFNAMVTLTEKGERVVKFTKVYTVNFEGSTLNYFR